jgi:hypothetical protein
MIENSATKSASCSRNTETGTLLPAYDWGRRYDRTGHPPARIWSQFTEPAVLLNPLVIVAALAALLLVGVLLRWAGLRPRG